MHYPCSVFMQFSVVYEVRGKLNPGILPVGSPTSDEFRTSQPHVLFHLSCKSLSFVTPSHIGHLNFSLYLDVVLCYWYEVVFIRRYSVVPSVQILFRYYRYLLIFFFLLNLYSLYRCSFEFSTYITGNEMEACCLINELLWEFKLVCNLNFKAI